MSESVYGSDWQEVRKEALKRDGYICQFCGIEDEEHKREHGRGLDVHHIFKARSIGANELENTITVCRHCHGTLETLHADFIERDLENRLKSDVEEGIKFQWRHAEESLRRLDRQYGVRFKIDNEFKDIPDGTVFHLVEEEKSAVGYRLGMYDGWIMGAQNMYKTICENMDWDVISRDELSHWEHENDE